MIALIAGTNRPDSKTLQVAGIANSILAANDHPVTLIDLADLPQELFSSASYADKPASFDHLQQTILDADGILTVVPEYNGSFPGVLKYFLDMLRFPESLYETPAGFIGLSAGRWGALRAVEHLEMVFQYRHAHLFGRRCFLPRIHNTIDGEGRLTDQGVADRLEKTVLDFADFCRRLGRSGGHQAE